MAGGEDDFEGANGPAYISRINFFSCEGSSKASFSCNHFGLFDLARFSNTSRNSRFGFTGGGVPPLGHRLNILTRPANQEGEFSSRVNISDRFFCSLLEYRDGPRLVGIRNVNEVMWNPGAFRCRGLCRSNVHASVEQPGIS